MSHLYRKRTAAGFMLVLLMATLSPAQRIPGIIDVADLQQAALFAFGQEAGDQLKVQVTGDFNGDGLTDILLATHLFDGFNRMRPTSGAAYIVFGTSKGIILRTLGSLAEPREDVTFFGADATDRFSLSAASGDINGDGIDDIIIGAPQADGPENLREDAGEVYIFFGSTDLMSGTIRDAAGMLAEGADITIFGQQTGDVLGSSLSLGDVNGDGLTDLLIGATGTFGPGDFRAAAGSVQIIFGGPRTSTQGVIDLADPLAGADVVIHGGDPVDLGGFNVKAGDLNADGIDDIVLSVPLADGPANRRLNAGEVHVLFGGPDLAGEPVRDLAAVLAPGADLTIFGEFPGDGLGLSLAIGDVSGDGVDDLVVSAQALVRLSNLPGVQGRSGAGEVYVFLGSRTLQSEDARDINGQVGRPPDLTIFGAEGQTTFGDQPDRFGATLTLSDLNGDGISDLIVGAPGADGPDNGRLNAGEVDVIYGGADLFVGLPRDMAGEHGRPADLSLLGPEATAGFGATVTVTDIDFDGLNDLVVGAPNSGGRGGSFRNAGTVFFISGD